MKHIGLHQRVLDRFTGFCFQDRTPTSYRSQRSSRASQRMHGRLVDPPSTGGDGHCVMLVPRGKYMITSHNALVSVFCDTIFPVVLYSL